MSASAAAYILPARPVALPEAVPYPLFVERNSPVATKQPHSGAMSLRLKSLVLFICKAFFFGQNLRS